MIGKLNHIPADVPGLWDGYLNHIREKNITAPKVVIHGGYGKRNMGDDAILHVLINRVQEYIPNAKITIVCHGPDNIAMWYPDSETCHFKSWQAVKAIWGSNIYFIGGGGIINKINTYSGSMALKFFDMKGKFLFIAAFLAKLTGAKTHFYGIGATSFPDPVVKFLAKFVLSRADVVSVRDPLSIKNLKALGIKRELVQVLDPALSLKPAPPEDAHRILNTLGLTPKADRKRSLVGINIRYVRDPEVDNERSLNETARLVDYLIQKKHCDVLFLPISQHPSKHFEDDLDFGRQVEERLENREGTFLLKDYHHPRRMMALLGEMDCMILSRLHAVILGSQMKVPIFTVSYDNKVTQFVKLIGGENQLIDLADFTMEKMSELLADKLDLLSHSSLPNLIQDH